MTDANQKKNKLSGVHFVVIGCQKRTTVLFFFFYIYQDTSNLRVMLQTGLIFSTRSCPRTIHWCRFSFTHHSSRPLHLQNVCVGLIKKMNEQTDAEPKQFLKSTTLYCNKITLLFKCDFSDVSAVEVHVCPHIHVFLEEDTHPWNKLDKILLSSQEFDWLRY